MKNDCRTWWRKLGETITVPPVFSNEVYPGDKFDYYYEDPNTRDCMTEQLWAIREGFAEESI